MSRFSWVPLVFGLVGLWSSMASCAPRDNGPIAIVVHGGAGTIPAHEITPERATAYKSTLARALQAGYDVLDRGGTSVDAVVATITILENSPLFNAGVGAVFTYDGWNELDAAIMDGGSLEAGAVAAVRHVANPIQLARMVMEDSPHVLLVGDGAEEFALSQGMNLVPSDHFHTPRRWKQHQDRLDQDFGLGVAPTSPREFGTVGAAALDRQGNLAAGTSTGGMTNKRFGRVGDSPIIGAGTYANNATLAISATGHGEYFMRAVAAHDISAMMEYADLSLEVATQRMITEKLGGEGGVIAVDSRGNIAMEYNTEGMYRGAINRDGVLTVGIHGELEAMPP